MFAYLKIPASAFCGENVHQLWRSYFLFVYSPPPRSSLFALGLVYDEETVRIVAGGSAGRAAMAAVQLRLFIRV